MRPLLAAVALALAGCEGGAPPERPWDVAQRVEVATDDGASVVLHRHPADGPPVLVVHGISSNHRCWDLAPDRSLALALQSAGLDAWLLDLRGHGDSTRDAEGGVQRTGWTMDDYGLHDVPAAVDAIVRATGAPGVGYVGHSMGGMVAAITLTRRPEVPIRALVAVGSPLDFSDPDPLLRWALGAAQAALPVVPTPLGARLAAEMPGLPLPVDALLFQDIASPQVREEMYRSIVSPLTRGELLQLVRSGEAGRLVSADGSLDVLSALQDVRVPALILAGRADRIAPVDRVLPWVEHLGGEDVTFRVAGRATGFAADYGHLDLPLGDHAAAEVYPLIVDWLRERLR